MTDADADRSVSEAMAEVEANIEAADRTFWRYGIPAVLAAWFTVGLLVGLVIGVAIS